MTLRLRLRAPNTFVLLGCILVGMAALTWILPGGAYQRQEVQGRTVVVPGTFEPEPGVPQGVGSLLMAPLRGFVAAAEIIGFVLIVGGVFGLLHKTRAIDAGIGALAAANERSSLVRRLAIPVFMTLFSTAGAVFGMSEEVIPFVLIFIPLALALGYDTITGVAIPFVGAGAGFAGAFLNPFTVGIAQGIADLPPFSGIGYRLVVWAACTALAIVFVLRHASRVRKHPERSPTFDADLAARHEWHLQSDERVSWTRRHGAVLTLFAVGMAVLTFGVLRYGWYIEEIAAVFLAIGLAAVVAGRLSTGESIDAFIAGAKDLLPTALVIALARGILVLAEDGRIIDTLLHGLSGWIDRFHPIVSAQTMFLVQTAINFFVPSGSGQAALTMPIMAPLSDLVGVSRQTAVLAFQMGDGFSNLIIPTSAVTLGVLTLARVEWAVWARWILPLQILFLALGLVLLIPPFYFGW